MKLVGWKTKRREFLAACLFAGMALVARADSDLTANGKKAEVKGVIVSRSGDLVKVQEEKSGEIVLVKLGDNTIIERERGLHLFCRHTDMDVTALEPGLTIEAEGVGNAEAQLEATKVKFNPDVFAVEVAEEEQVRTNKAAVGQAQTTADRGVTDAAAAQTSANQAQSSANQAQSSADQGVATAVAAGIAADTVNRRVSDLGDYTTVTQVQVYFANDGSKLDSDSKAALDQLAAATSGTKGYLIEVAGYASSSGSAEHNQKLSEDVQLRSCTSS